MCRISLVNFVDMRNLKVCRRKILRIRLTEIEFESNFSKLGLNSYISSQLLEILKIRSLRLNLGVNFSSSHSIYYTGTQ